MTDATVKHFPIFGKENVIEYYSKKDGVPIRYVCTTELKPYGTIFDVFYRDTPHPEFGNRYFGIGYHNGSLVITDADNVEQLSFCCIGDGNGFWTYSRGTHHFKNFGDNAIDGGRSYTRIVGNLDTKVKTFVVKDGECKWL